MKSQNNLVEKKKLIKRPNYRLGLYTLSIALIVVTYTLVAASQYLY